MKNFILSFSIIFFSFASSASSQAGEAIEEFGQIIFSKETSSYYFVFQRDHLTFAYQIPVKSKADRERLKSLIGKMVHVNGDVNFVRNHRDSFSGREEVTLNNVNQFDYKLLAFDMKKFLAQEKYISHERPVPLGSDRGFISVSDETANSLIGVGAVTLGILTGPLSLVPLGIFGLTQF